MTATVPTDRRCYTGCGRPVGPESPYACNPCDHAFLAEVNARYDIRHALRRMEASDNPDIECCGGDLDAGVVRHRHSCWKLKED